MVRSNCRCEEEEAGIDGRSPDNGLLTPAMKLARPVIAKRFSKEIEKSYGRAL
jgi:long-subunit acyl-CoA synthetase (AMP-forming)